MADKSLHLLRHAKSSWAAAGAEDHDRPLAPRGERAATLVGVYLGQLGVLPDLVLCSTALRTRQTAERVLAECAPRATVRYLQGLYMAAPRQLKAAIATVPEECATLLVIGHNPGLHEFALQLAQDGDAAALAELRKDMPTAALASFAVTGTWRLAAANARLTRYQVPRDMV